MWLALPAHMRRPSWATYKQACRETGRSPISKVRSLLLLRVPRWARALEQPVGTSDGRLRESRHWLSEGLAS